MTLVKKMFNFTSKPLIMVLLVSLSFNGLFGYLSYKFHADASKAEQALVVAVEANKGLEKSILLQDTACKIADSVSTENQKDQKEVEQLRQKALDEIDAIPSISNPTRSENKAQINEEIHYVDIDSNLPPSLVELLSESYHNLQRQGDSDAGQPTRKPL
jgi:hypothetical protein